MSDQGNKKMKEAFDVGKEIVWVMLWFSVQLIFLWLVMTAWEEILEAGSTIDKTYFTIVAAGVTVMFYAGVLRWLIRMKLRVFVLRHLVTPVFLIETLIFALLIIFMYAAAYYHNGIVGPESSCLCSDTLASDVLTPFVYFSVVTFTTLGYGDFQPMPASRILAASEAIIGYVFLAISLGAFVQLMWLVERPRNRDE